MGDSSDEEMTPIVVKNTRRVAVSAETIEDSEEPSKMPFFPKTPDQIQRINTALKGNFLFKALDEEQYKDLVDAMFEKKVESGVDIIEQGAPGDYFYVVDSGSFDIFVNGDKKVTVGLGASFGELALLYNAPRAATVKATSDSVVWAVDRVSFRHMLKETTLKKRRLYEGFLAEVPLFQSLVEEERHKIADALESLSFNPGQVVIKQGDIGERFFIIEDGDADVTKLEDGKLLHLGTLTKGRYFGELALINDAPRVATITAKSKLKCVSLDKGAFTRLLGPLLPILRRNVENYKKITGEEIAPLPAEPSEEETPETPTS